ncbi:phosphatase PAP2 family protein [Gillisia sp. M10.2A]|uniref:Phosphatase PAP2 family protein n=1 Tax=Gillisia lutea TaxID=2909668 RepID=A0ABS9EJV4_9FLAO|nr:phosphatase PAP2 family protein [Gillisia lutea]MCF4102090.1 phosphatase PAP2 family protein [Gillisia lutea]
MLDKILAYDTELFLYLNNLGNSTWDPFWLLITDKWTAIPLYAFLLFLIFKRFGVKGTLVTIVLIALLITATDQLANVFKHGFERPRPCRAEGVMEFARYIAERCGRFGFYSAHASNSTALALFIGLMLKKVYPKLLWFLLIWALVVSYSRIYVGVHYPLDVLTGMTMGAIIGYLISLLHPVLMKKFKVPF